MHSVFIIQQLKSVSDSISDLYKHSQLNKLSSIYVNSDTKTFKSFKVECLLDKRIVKRECEKFTEYLIRWKEYRSEHNKYMNLKNLSNFMNLIQNYEAFRDKQLI